MITRTYHKTNDNINKIIKVKGKIVHLKEFTNFLLTEL